MVYLSGQPEVLVVKKAITEPYKFDEEIEKIHSYYGVRDKSKLYEFGDRFILSYFTSSYIEKVSGGVTQNIELDTYADVKSFIEKGLESYYVVYLIEDVFNQDEKKECIRIIFAEVNASTCHPAVKKYMRINSVTEILAVL